VTEFLSPEELSDLCGSRGVLSQMRWLWQNEVAFKFGGKRIYVLRSWAQERGVLAPSEARLDLVR
jgi:hypothetical protein